MTDEYRRRLKKKRETIKKKGIERRPQVFEDILQEAHELYGDQPKGHDLTRFIDYVDKEAHPEQITTQNSLDVDREQRGVVDAQTPEGFLSQLFLGLDEQGRRELPRDALKAAGAVVASPFTVPYGITDKMYSGGMSLKDAINEEFGTSQLINTVAGQAKGVANTVQGRPSRLTQEQKNAFTVLGLSALAGGAAGPARGQLAKRKQFKKNQQASSDATRKTWDAGERARRSDIRAEADNSRDVYRYMDDDGSKPSVDTMTARAKQAEAANLAADAALPDLNSMNRLGRQEVFGSGKKRGYLDSSLEDRLMQDSFLRDNLTHAQLFSTEIDTILSNLEKYKKTK